MSVQGAIGVLAFLGLVGGVPAYVLAQEQPGIGVVSTLIGEATVARGTTTKLLALKMRDDVFMQDRISTKERSLVHVLMGGKALLTVRELSVLTITEDGGRATVDLQSGKIGLAVLRQKMKPGEIIEIRTPHAVAAVRGTVLVVEIVPGSENQPGAGGASTNVHLLHGKLDVSLASNPTARPIQLESLQSVTASSHALGLVRPLTPEGVAAVTANLKMNHPSLPGPSESLVAAIGEKQRKIAVAVAIVLTNDGPRRGKLADSNGRGVVEKKDGLGNAAKDPDAIGFVADTGYNNGVGNGSNGGNGNGNGNGQGNGLAQGLSGGNGNGSGAGLGGGNGLLGGSNGLGGGNGLSGGNGSGGGNTFAGSILSPILPNLKLRKGN